METLKRFIDCYIPTETCNLKCHYCYITQQKKFNNKLVKFEHSAAEIRRALSKKRLGGECLLNFCAGGETLLSEDVLKVAHELLLEGHYLMIVTNGTITKRFQQIAKWEQDVKERILFKFSFHYLELKRLNMMDVYFNNVRMMRDAGCSYTVEVTPNDELIPYIEDLKKICLEEVGAYPHITIARDDRTKEINHLSRYAFDEYKKIWSVFESALFDFKATIFYKKRHEFCYAGDWSLYLNLSTGEYQQCQFGHYLGNIFNNMDKPLRLCSVGNKCKYPHCYNGHGYLTLGTIPELITPTLYEMRDRKTINDTTWVTPTFKNFITQKLYNNNIVYSVSEKKWANRKNSLIIIRAHMHQLFKKIRKRLKE